MNLLLKLRDFHTLRLFSENTDAVFISTTPALPFFIPFNIYVEVQLFKEGSPREQKCTETVVLCIYCKIHSSIRKAAAEEGRQEEF